MPTTVTYFFDPLCGWCYAAAPALTKLQATPGVHLVMAPTGLFAGAGARPLDAEFAAYAWSNDQRIQQLTGQPFSDRYRNNILGQQGARFDSGPAMLALTAVAQTEPAQELAALHAFQHARYEDGRDTTALPLLADVLATLALHAAAARVREPDDALRAAMWERVAAARSHRQALGAHGVPQLAVHGMDAGRPRLLGSGTLLGPWDALLAQVLAPPQAAER